jgi:Holliday junction resolvase YEN1
MQLDGLREFTRETFDWDYRIGAIKFIRVLSQALLVRKMLQDEAGAEKHVQKITGRRKHFSTDATSELRVSYVPGDVVPIDLSAEVDEVISSGREGLALNSDEEFEAPEEAPDAAAKGKVFDVTKPELAWVLECVARKAVPSVVVSWEEAEAAKALRKSPAKKRTTTAERTKKATDPQKGAMDQFVRTTKSSQLQASTTKIKPPSSPPKQTCPRRPAFRRPQTPPPAPSSSKPSTPSTTGSLVRFTADWTISSSQNASPRTPPASTRQRTARPAAQYHPETIVLSSSPAADEGVFDGAGRDEIGEVAESVRAILAEGSAHGKVNARNRRLVREPSSREQLEAQPKAKLKQTSMDVFAKRQPKIPTATTTPPKRYPQSSADQPITIDSSPISPTALSPSKRHSSQPSSPPLRTTSPSPSPRKKKLLIPRTSGAGGFFETLEVEQDDVDDVFGVQTKRLEARGVRAGVVRWSDVTEIDLTGEDGDWKF